MKNGTRSRWRGRWVAVALAGLLSAGCTLLPESESLVVYRLPAAAEAAGPSASGLPHALRVGMPLAGGMASSSRILVLPQGNEVSAYAGVRWTDPAPRLVRDRLARSLRADGRLASVSVDAGQSHADLELASELDAFQVEYGQEEGAMPAVRIALEASLLRPDAGRIVASRRFEIVQPMTGTEVPQAVEAYGMAADALSKQVTEWVLAQAARAPLQGR